MDNNFKVGDKFIVVSPPRDTYWRDIKYHCIGWKGVITNINGRCTWLKEYTYDNGKITNYNENWPFDIKSIKKIPVKRISPYTYWLSITFGEK